MPLSAKEFSEIDLKLRQYEFADSRDRAIVLELLSEYRVRTKLLKPHDKRLSFYDPPESSISPEDSEAAGDHPTTWKSG